MAFLKKALKTAESILDQVDEGVVKGSRLLTIDGIALTGDDRHDEDEVDSEELLRRLQERRQVGEIVKAEDRIGNVEGVEEELAADPAQNDEVTSPSQNLAVEGDVVAVEEALGVPKLGEAETDQAQLEEEAEVNLLLGPEADGPGSSPAERKGDGRLSSEGVLVSALREERDELRHQLELREQALVELNGTLESMVSKIRARSTVDEKLLEAEMRIGDLERIVEESKWEKKDLKKVISEKEDLCENLDIKIRSLNDELESLRENFRREGEKDSNDVNGARRETVEAVLAHEREIANHNETRLKLQRRIEKLEGDAVGNFEAITNADRITDEARAAAKEAETVAADCIRERDQAVRKARTLEEKIADMDSAYRSKEELSATVLALQARVEALETELEFRQAKIVATNSEVHTLREALESSNRLNQAQAISGNDASSIDQVHAQLRYMADSTMKAQSELETLRGENRALKHQLETERRRTIEAQAIAAASSSRHAPRELGREIRRGVLPLKIPRRWPMLVSRLLEMLDDLAANVTYIMRREPAIRLGVIIYVVALHIFIFSIIHHGVIVHDLAQDTPPS
uniref:Golgin-84 n=1 Tax=Rhodosorus marinus TaxID=101924 RepID=A0A7S3AAI9_9RHOD|mmetsp:Transcript_9169/g.40183  ORF Transcript_9169/g.40183 Transcript_9169/m.40183 type:complete len:578 (+) Transcript_9169:532-2265(+)|eukprot:CAMPEP_0113960798 /NCGR_PEP_ID=MMETSP0011_2-20120614/4928_1 /TAXON_ID=101924 /ORGANISM="Rhodosorus marinus" /LENGTH=577 /DNA_ID=CAMNT_0000972317 /DNA_START=452 /DNA_END=2185 /DNA_ORIENTATION=- /assembly_acc=CAM_ASM_000156